MANRVDQNREDAILMEVDGGLTEEFMRLLGGIVVLDGWQMTICVGSSGRECKRQAKYQSRYPI